jgi:hypothetical protein
MLLTHDGRRLTGDLLPLWDVAYSGNSWFCFAGADRVMRSHLAQIRALEGMRVTMVVDLISVPPQIHLNNFFRFGKAPHPREAHFAVYTAC